MTLNALLNSEKVLVMGILNVTPDSFFDGGKYNLLDNALKHAQKMIAQGADIIDIGGESTRPGAETVDEKEEAKRIVPVITRLAKQFKNIVISVDTYKSSVAKTAIDSGAAMVNDISGLSFSPSMAKLVSEKNAHVIIMHIKGTPKDMQAVGPVYKNVVEEINDFFRRKIDYAAAAGVKKEKILIDPGIGFGKTTQHNLEILRNLKKFSTTGCPIVLGTSRKSFIGKILGTEDKPLPANERLYGSLATYACAYSNSIRVLRVHDVKETKQFLRTLETINRARGEKGST
ncbi:MAG: dihydropteroate synthase [Elusimicrobia bacterium RIFOXYA2_FULL_40_6]|nr:MAG: dihydropteroate synthase [Elusimicrobia bacterium RIFOXYA2_FULL_40_6]